MDESEPSDSPGAEERSVFGNLPDSRPSVRSPRRRGSKKEAATDGAAAASASKPSRPRPTRPSRPEARGAPPQGPPRAPEPEAPPSGEAGGAGLEELAWAGITVAAEAATLGVRLLSRAVEAVRKPADRR